MRIGTWPSYGSLLLLLMRPVRDRRRVRYTPGSVPVCWVIGESERTKARIWGWTTTRYVHSSLVDRLGTNSFELEQPTVSETVESGWWSIRGTGKTVPCRISVQRGHSGCRAGVSRRARLRAGLEQVSSNIQLYIRRYTLTTWGFVQ